MTNYLFIDDSGSKQWKTPYAKDFIDHTPERSPAYRDFWQGNYFVLAGIHTNSKTMSKLNMLINEAKENYFGTKDIEIHSVDLRNPYNQRKKYLQPYDLESERLKEFIDTFWYPLFSQYNLQLVAIVVDKRYFDVASRGEIPLEIATKALFDQTETHPHKNCHIVFDQMDSQLRSSKHDQGKILRIANTNIKLDDGSYAKKFHHTSIQFDKSCNSNFLQLADTVAYNTWRQFVDFGHEWDKHSVGEEEHRVLPMYEYFARIANNFYCGKSRTVSGVGLIKLPDPFNDCVSCKRWRIIDQLSKNTCHKVDVLLKQASLTRSRHKLRGRLRPHDQPANNIIPYFCFF